MRLLIPSPDLNAGMDISSGRKISDSGHFLYFILHNLFTVRFGAPGIFSRGNLVSFTVKKSAATGSRHPSQPK